LVSIAGLNTYHATLAIVPRVGGTAANILNLGKKDRRRKWIGANSSIEFIAIRPQGDLFVCCKRGGQLELYGPTGILVRAVVASRPVTAAAFTDDGNHFITGDADRTIQIRNWVLLPVRTMGRTYAVPTCLATRGGLGKIMVGMQKGYVSLCNGSTGELGRDFHGISSTVERFWWSADGRRMFCKAGDCYSAWNDATGESICDRKPLADLAAADAPIEPGLDGPQLRSLGPMRGAEVVGDGHRIGFFPYELEKIVKLNEGDSWVASFGSQLFVLELEL
jgi:hypothetical protein